MKVLVTGSAGFKGFTTAKKLLERGDEVLGIDNLNDYYDPSLKKDRLNILDSFENFFNTEMDIADTNRVDDFFKTHTPQRVVHLAAQAGVRYSLENPFSYINSNITGFLNILEGGCTAPIGAYSKIKNNTLVFKGGLFSLDGKEAITVNDQIPLIQHKEFGKKAARKILKQGGVHLLKKIKSKV